MLKNFSNIENRWKKFFTTFFLISPILILFIFPIFSLKMENKNDILINFTKIITNNVMINFKNRKIFLNFPFFIKFSLLVNMLFLILGAIFFKLKKFIFSAFWFFCSASTVFMFVLAICDFKKQILNLNIEKNEVFVCILWPYFLLILVEISLSIYTTMKKGKEKLAELVFFSCCILTIFIISSMIIYVIIHGAPAIFKIGFFNFIFGLNWEPNNENFGILKLIMASIFSTFGAVFLAIPIGVLAATFLSEIANKKIAYFFNSFIEIVAGIPSVIFGFFGMIVIVPTIKKIFMPLQKFYPTPIVGDSLLAVILVLFMMILPTIVTTSFVSLKNVPKSFKEASLNLGATKIQTIFKITIKSAKQGIFSGITLSIAKALGETMAVMMVAGNVVCTPHLLSPVRLLTTGIAIDMSYSSGLFRQALFGIGLVLFTLTIIINITFNKILKKMSF